MKKIGSVLVVLIVFALFSGVALAGCEDDFLLTFETFPSTQVYLPVAGHLVAGYTDIVLGANCIEQGLQCTLNGTPCCEPYKCKGKFPNTYCQE
jgi:hypothetical protein